MEVLRARLRELPLLEEVLVLRSIEADWDLVSLLTLTCAIPLDLIGDRGGFRSGLRELTGHVPSLDLQLEVWLELTFLLLDLTKHRHLHVACDHRVLE